MVQKIRCTHCETQKSDWCEANCNFAWQVEDKHEPAPAVVVPFKKQRKPTIIAKKVECLDDGSVYESAKALAEILGVTQTAIQNCCNHTSKSRMVHGKQYRYLGDERRVFLDITPKRGKKHVNCRQSAPVYGIFTKERYASCAEAADKIGMSKNSIYQYLAMGDNNPNKRFKYLED